MKTLFVPLIIVLLTSCGGTSSSQPTENSAPQTNTEGGNELSNASGFSSIEQFENMIISLVELMNSEIINRPELLNELLNFDFYTIDIGLQNYFNSPSYPEIISTAQIKVETLKFYFPFDVAPSQQPYALHYKEYSETGEEIHSFSLKSLWGCSRDFSHPTARCVQYSVSSPSFSMSGSVNLVPVETDGLTYFERK